MTRRGVSVFGASIDSMARSSAAGDAAGFDSVWTSELYNRSASIPLAAMAQATRSCQVGSGIMYGVGRSPLILSAEARDLAELSDGRFTLGLGNGTRKMISDWHGLDPESPALRMEELVPLLRQLWALQDAPVDHEGRFYRVKVTALPDIGPQTAWDIPIYIAGVNPRMIQSAGRVADGLLGHTMFTPKYLEDVVLPALEKGAQHAGRDRSEVSVVTFALASVCDDPEVARREIADMIAFYGSVKTYGNLFETCGFAREAEEIREAFRRGEADKMGEAVSDRMVEEFGLAGTAAEIQQQLRRFEGLVDEVVLFAPSNRVSRGRVDENLALLISDCAPVSAVSA